MLDSIRQFRLDRKGFSKRYGLVYVDRMDEDLEDLKRYKKDSFYWYQKLIRDYNK